MPNRRPSELQKWLLFFTLTALIVVSVGVTVARTQSVDMRATELLNVAISGLALLSAIALASADALTGIHRKSVFKKVRVASWMRLTGHGALIASLSYLVVLNVHLAWPRDM